MSTTRVPDEPTLLPDGRTRLRTKGGTLVYWWLTCQECGMPKGKSDEPHCMRCRRGPRTGLRLHCPTCGEKLDRNAIVVALHYAGASYSELGDLFRLSKVQVGRIVRGVAVPEKRRRRWDDA